MSATLVIFESSSDSIYLRSSSGEIVSAVLDTRLPRLLTHTQAVLPVARVKVVEGRVSPSVIGKTCLLYSGDRAVLYGRIRPGGYVERGGLTGLTIDCEIKNPSIPYVSTEVQSLGSLAKEIADNNQLSYNADSAFWTPVGLTPESLLQGRASQSSPRRLLDMLATCLWEADWDVRFVPFSTDSTLQDGTTVTTWATRVEAIARVRETPAGTPVVHVAYNPGFSGDEGRSLVNNLTVYAGGQGEYWQYRDLDSIRMLASEYPGVVHLAFVAPTAFQTGLWAHVYLNRFGKRLDYSEAAVDGFWQAGDLFTAQYISGPLSLAPHYADGDTYMVRKVVADLVHNRSEIGVALRLVDVGSTPTEPISPDGGGGGGEGGDTEEQVCYFPWASTDASTLPDIPAQSAEERTDKDFRPKIGDGTLDELPTAGELTRAKPVVWELRRLWSADPEVAEPWDWEGIAIQPDIVRPVFDDSPREYTARIGEGIFWELPRATYQGGVVRYAVTEQLSWVGYDAGAHRLVSGGALEDQTPSIAGTEHSFFLTATAWLANGFPVRDNNRYVVTSLKLTIKVVSLEDEETPPVGDIRDLSAKQTGTGNDTGLVTWKQPGSDDEPELDGILNYRVEWVRDGHDDWVGANTADAAHVSMPLRNLPAGYLLNIRAKALGDTSKGYTDAVSWQYTTLQMGGIAPKTPLSTPGVPAVAGPENRPHFAWTASLPAAHVEKYKLERRKNAFYSWSTLIEVQTNSIDHDQYETLIEGKGEWDYRVVAIAEPGSTSDDSEPSGVFRYNAPVVGPRNSVPIPTGLDVPLDHIFANSAKLLATSPVPGASDDWVVTHIEFRWAHRGAISATNPWVTGRAKVTVPGQQVSVSPSDLDDAVNYQWGARSISGTMGRNDSRFTSGSGFTTPDDPDGPSWEGTVGTPTNPQDTGETKNSVNLSWGAPPAGVAGYIVRIWETGKYTETLRKIPVPAGITATTVRGLKSGTSHGWNVRATPDARWYAGSPTADQTFSTLVDPDADKAAKVTGFGVVEKVRGAVLSWDVHPDRGGHWIYGAVQVE